MANIWDPPAGTSGGTYGEGNVGAALTALQDLKKQVSDGKLNLTDYYAKADPIVQQAGTWYGQIAGGGSKPASAVNSIWTQLLDNNFISDKGGKHVTTLPFSRTEYAKLPDNVLPTKQDVTSGLIDPSSAPFERYRTSGPTTGTNGGTPTDPNAIPTDIPLGSDRGGIELESKREKEQSLAAIGQASDLRNQGLSNLGDILQKQNQAQFNYDLPDIKENLQSSGLFSSPSALASAVARESGMLGANTASMLGQQGVSNINLTAEGLLGATQNQQGLQQGGLQRQFSLDDWQKQAQLAREVGASQIPQQSSNGISSYIPGVLEGSAAGAPFGSIGAIAGAVLGGASQGGKKGTFICTAMKEIGILTEEEVQKIHDHLFPIFPKRIIQVLFYGVHGPRLVEEAKKKGIDWKKWKELFFGRVVEEKDQEKAFDLYVNAFVTLWKEVI